MKQSPFVYNACCSIDHEEVLFCLAPAKLAPLKVRLVNVVAGVSKLYIVLLSRPTSSVSVSDMYSLLMISQLMVS